VNGGFKAGAVEVDVIKVDVVFEAKVNGARRACRPGKQGNEAGVDGSQSGFVDEVSEAVAGAFGEGFDSFNAANLEEPLEQ